MPEEYMLGDQRTFIYRPVIRKMFWGKFFGFGYGQFYCCWLLTVIVKESDLQIPVLVMNDTVMLVWSKGATPVYS